MSMPNFVAKTLQQRILSGVYVPGDVLPGQRELAGQLGVSRGALREAVSVLTTLGFVRSVPGKGTFVVHPGGPDAEPAGHHAVHTMQLRYIVEPATAALAARACGPDCAAKLRELQARFRDALLRNDLVDAAATDLAFHQSIAVFSGNEVLAEMSRSFEDRIGRSQRFPLANTPRLIEAFEEHEPIVEAIIAGNAGVAQAAMQRHLRNAAERAGIAFQIP